MVVTAVVTMVICLFTGNYAVLCEDVQLQNICDLLDNPCENGVCVNLGNDYRCSCNKGFLVSDDQQSCNGECCCC